MKIRRTLALLALLSPVLAAAAPIRVLIVDGFSNHNWPLTTALIRGIIEPTGLFQVGVSTAPPKADAPGWDAWRPKFADYDVVIQHANDINGGPSWPREVQVAFEEFVTKGGGVYVWHAGNNAFPTWPAYNDMIGLGWRKKDFGVAIAVDEQEALVRIPVGEGRDTGHGARLDTVVKRRGEHPIHAGLPRAWKTPDIEVYYHARGPAKNLEVLSYGFDPRTQMNWPLEWAVAYGQGRVYTSTFGHVWKDDTQPERMRCAGLQTVVVRALQWLARREVTFAVPADFPTAEKVSIRGEIPLPPQAPHPTVAAEATPALLFNRQNLDGWQVFIEGVDGPVADQKIFQVSDGAIHVYRDATAGTKQPFAMLVTKEEFSDYRLSLEYRWGEKKFAPRAGPEVPKDAGVCYHVRGPIVIWPVSVECQIQFGDTGDVWAIKTQATSTEHPDTRGFYDPAEGGVEVTRGGLPLGYHRFVRRACLEREGWNRVDVIVRGDSATHIVNGQVNNEVRRMKYWDATAGAWVPLKRGRILLQAEGAEILYRNVTLTPLP